MNKRLYRSRKGRMVGGVATGLAEYFDVDPVIMRAIFVITTIGWGGGILAYIILWIIVPEKPFAFHEQTQYDPDNKENEFDEEYQDADHKNEDYKDEDYDYREMVNKGKPRYHSPSGNGKTLFGVLLVVLGFIFLLNNIFPHFDFDYIWPFALVGFGIYILYSAMKRKKEGGYHETE